MMQYAILCVLLSNSFVLGRVLAGRSVRVSNTASSRFRRPAPSSPLPPHPLASCISWPSLLLTLLPLSLFSPLLTSLQDLPARWIQDKDGVCAAASLPPVCSLRANLLQIPERAQRENCMTKENESIDRPRRRKRAQHLVFRRCVLFRTPHRRPISPAEPLPPRPPSNLQLRPLLKTKITLQPRTALLHLLHQVQQSMHVFDASACQAR